MSFKRCAALVCGCAGVWVLSSNISFSQTTVTGIELVSSTRSGRTTFDYVYRIRVTNGAPAVNAAVATVSTSARGTSILRNVVQLGNLRESSQVISQDTFVIRQDRLYPFNPSALSWQVTGTPVQLPPGPLQITSAAFVELKGRPDHEGWKAIPGSVFMHDPLPATFSATLSAPIANGVLRLLTPAGASITSVALSAYERSSAYAPTYHAQLPTPGTAFRIQLAGISSSGAPVELDWPQLFLPVSAHLRFVREFAEVTPGGTSRLLLRVTNGPLAQPFRLHLESTLAQASLQPTISTFDLASGEAREIEVFVSLPAGTSLPEGGILQARLIGQRDATAHNSASALLEVVASLTPQE